MSIYYTMLILSSLIYLGANAIPEKNPQELFSYDDFKQKLNLKELALEDTLEHDKTTGKLVSDDELLEQVSPFLMSRSIESVGLFLKNDAIPLDQKILLLNTLIDNKRYNLSQEDAVRLVLDVANAYPSASDEQLKIFGVLLEHKQLLGTVSPLLIAVQHDYIQTIVPLIKWSLEHAAIYPSVQKDLLEVKMKAILRAIGLGDVRLLDKINALSGSGITPEEATEAAWYVVTSEADPTILVKLKAFGADLENIRGKKTLLIAAVESGRENMVQQLIDLKVKLDAIGDLEYGSALQRAIALRNTSMEELLRHAGARE